MPLRPAVACAEQSQDTAEKRLSFGRIRQLLKPFNHTSQFFEKSRQPVRLRHLGGSKHLLHEALDPVVEAVLITGAVVFNKLQSDEPVQGCCLGKLRCNFRRNPVVPIFKKSAQGIPDVGLKYPKETFRENRHLVDSYNDQVFAALPNRRR